MYYDITGPLSYIRSVVDRNVVMRRMTLLKLDTQLHCTVINAAPQCYCSHRGTFRRTKIANLHKMWKDTVVAHCMVPMRALLANPCHGSRLEK
jgi:hypothetical protein